MNESPKIEYIHIRISKLDKEKIKKYINERGIKLSDFIRNTCLEKIEKETKVNE